MLIQINEPGKSDNTQKNELLDVAVGIDLGTTNSLVAVSHDEKPVEITNESGEFITPSIISLDEFGEIQVGAIKSNQYIASVKRLMGKGGDDLEGISEYYGYDIDRENSKKIINLKIGDKKITPVEFSGKILSKLKSIAEKSLSKKVCKAVITVPAYFNDAQRQATKDAAQLSGLEVLRLINEPTAAALAYGLDKGAEGLYAVYDFGGGTFDVSILKMKMGVFKVIATGGDDNLGGDDIDISLAKIIQSKLGDVDISQQELKSIAKQAKESIAEEKTFQISVMGKIINVSNEEFASASLPVISKTIDIFEGVIEDSEVEVEDLKGIILVGGSTRIPSVKRAIEKLTGKKPLSDINPDKVVAFGAAIQAEALTKGSSNLLLDVTPLSLGLETYGGLMEVVIPRNTPIPASVSQKFTTYEDGQTAMKVHVLQGERELVEDCRSLANFDLRGIPPKPSGGAVVSISFNIDADGILTVSAKEETTGVEQLVEVKPSYGLDVEAMEKMLISSMQQAKDDIFKRLLQEARVEADTVIRTLESGLKEDGDIISEEYYKKIQKQIEKLRDLCKHENREIIELETKNLDELGSDFADKRISKALKGYLGGKKVSEVL